MVVSRTSSQILIHASYPKCQRHVHPAGVPALRRSPQDSSSLLVTMDPGDTAKQKQPFSYQITLIKPRQ